MNSFSWQNPEGKGPRTVVIDNYDSFTYNLVQYLGELDCRLAVFRNDQITVDEVADLKPERIVISPGPGRPSDAGISRQLIRRFASKVPLLGVCLGHQAIGEEFGGRIVPAPELRHGKTSEVFHEGSGVFDGLPSPFVATRYHSLIVERATFPECLQIDAWTDDGIIMALRHREHPLVGLQFHPESIMTSVGKTLLESFLCLTD